MIMIDKLSYSSKLRYKNPCLKAFFSTSTLIICVATRSLIISIITLLVMGSLTVYNSKTSLKYYIKLFSLPVLFLLLSGFTIMINLSDTPLSDLAIPIGNHYITASTKSIYYGVQIMLASLASLSCLYFLSMTTPVTDLLYVMGVLHLPNLFIELLLLTYRFIFLLLDLSEALSISQRCRLGNKDMKTSIKSMSQLIVSVFIRALKKSSLLYDAMESRGYDGNIHVLKEFVPAAKNEVVAVLVFETLMIAVYIVQRMVL